MNRRHTAALRGLATLAILAAGTLATGLVLTVHNQPAQAMAIELDPADPKCADDITAARAAIDTLGVPLPAGWRLVLVCESSAGSWIGLAEPSTRTVTRRLGNPARPGDLEWGYLHEAGHAWEHEVLTDADRQRWQRTRGLPADVAWVDYGDGSFDAWASSPVEDFAEAFAACWLGGEPRWGWRPAGTTPPTAAECALLRELTGL